MHDDLRRCATLRDGSVVQIRPIESTDVTELRDGMRVLSPHSRYLRFHSERSELTPEEWRYLTEVDQVRHIAIVACVDGRIGGVARAITIDEGVAEVAFVVGDEVQRKGIGTLLRDVLVEAAGVRGIHTLRANVLAENGPMRRLLSPLERIGERDGVIITRCR